MHLGALLVLVGVILACLSVLTGLPVARGRLGTYPALLALGVVLIGIGVLVGQTVIS